MNPARSLCHRLGITARCLCDFKNTAWASCSNLACSLRLSREPKIIFGPKWLCPHNQLAVPVQGSCIATCDVSTGHAIFQNLSRCRVKLNHSGYDVVNLYDDCMVSLRRPHGKGDLGIINSSEGKCSQGINSLYKSLNYWDLLYFVSFCSIQKIEASIKYQQILLKWVNKFHVSLKTSFCIPFVSCYCRCSISLYMYVCSMYKVCKKINTNICCRYSKESSQWAVSTQNTCLDWWIRK